ncbi:unnamed protein product [Adineta ricciae]|uniref:DBH-like monooxygenase protein 1 n=1 Tax=Adineta ricciae TaxID=249248 RepID=A0A815EJV9_ADIRI|nr:unnamed protein product [Adineta ricciae]
MDVPIKSGTNILIFAYGLVDPDIDITYHEERRGTRILPLRSYSNQPMENIFNQLDFFDLHFEDLMVPSTDTTYYCKVFKSPTRFHAKRHAIAHEILIDPRNINLLHHLDLFECNSKEILDDTNLPDGICDEILTRVRMCSLNLATAWAVGADVVTMYPKEAGYAINTDIGSKYFMIKIHYDNPRLLSNLRDSSGIRFYLGDNLRENDMGYLVLGTSSYPSSLALPPNVKQFVVDSYCPPEATRNFPSSGVNVISALPHTHLQGTNITFCECKKISLCTGSTVWTKLIRNHTAVQYLFNAEAFDFNHQFANQLAKLIKVYPGGQRTVDEMCSHTFSYYPLVDSLSACMSRIDVKSWQMKMNTSLNITNNDLEQWMMNLTWTSQLAAEWQQFYDTAQRDVTIYRGNGIESKILPTLPKYKDLNIELCSKKTMNNNSLGNQSNASIIFENKFLLLVFVIFVVLSTGKWIV